MTATVPAARLKEAAAWANRSIDARPTVPVMSAAVLTVEDGELTISGWNWDDLTRMTAPAVGSLPRTLVSGRLMAEVAGSLTDDVTLALDGNRLLISAGRNSFRLPVIPDSDYPTTPDDPESRGRSADFAALVDRIAPSAATDTRLPISGITLSAAGGALAAGAFNGYLLSWSTIAWDGDDFWANPLARRLHDATKVMGEKVSIGIGNVLAVSDGERYAAMLVHDVPGADFTKAITAPLWDGHGHVDVDREELKRAVSNVRPMLGTVSTVRVTVEDGEAVVRADAGDLGDGTAGVGAHLDGEARTFAISGEYLTTALDGLDHEVVRVHFGPHINRPVLVTGVHDGAADMTTRHIIQPIKTR